MDQFSFFMSFYGLLLGLAVTELLLGFGNLIRARRQPRWGLLTPLLGLNIFIQIVATFSDAWRHLKTVTIDFAGSTVPALIEISLLLAALLCVPKDAEEWPDLDDYFRARRRIIVGALIAPNLLTIGFFELGIILRDSNAATQIAYGLVNCLLIGLLLVAALASRRGIVAAALAVNSVVLVIIYATSLNIAGMVGLLVGT